MTQEITIDGIIKLKPSTDLIATKIEYYKDIWNFDDINKNHLTGIEIDMSEVKIMDSSGIGLILSLFKECEENKNIQFRIINCTDNIKQLITLLKLDKILMNNNSWATKTNSYNSSLQKASST